MATDNVVFYITLACILISYVVLLLLWRRQYHSNRKWLELQADYQRLLQNYEALTPIKQAIDAAMAAHQPGESICLTITMQPIDPSKAPSTGLPLSNRLH